MIENFHMEKSSYLYLSSGHESFSGAIKACADYCGGACNLVHSKKIGEIVRTNLFMISSEIGGR